MVGRQNADTANTLHIGDVAMVTIFWHSVYGVHTGATWRIWLKRPCVAAMRPYLKLLWPLFNIHVDVLTVTRLNTVCEAWWVLTMLTCALCRQGDVWFLFDQFMYLLLGINYKTTTLLLDGKRIKLQLWYVLEIDTFITANFSITRPCTVWECEFGGTAVLVNT